MCAAVWCELRADTVCYLMAYKCNGVWPVDVLRLANVSPKDVTVAINLATGSAAASCSATVPEIYGDAVDALLRAVAAAATTHVCWKQASPQ